MTNQFSSFNHTSLADLIEFVAHADVSVRTEIADSKDTPAEILMFLAHDPSADLRYALAENHNIHADVLNLLAEDENVFVAHRARKTIARLRCSSAVALHFAKVELTIRDVNVV